jgi:hypothetical protein
MARIASASADPLLAESKVQTDLEAALVRVLPREKFLVLVNSEVRYQTERKLVEGEVYAAASEEKSRFVPMPGFVPEPQMPQDAPRPERQLYHSVDVPVLHRLRVEVSLDEKTPQPIVARAKQLVEQYLHVNYPGVGAASFAQVPMRSPATEATEAPTLARAERADDRLLPAQALALYGPWAMATLALLLLFASLFPTGRHRKVARAPKTPSGLSQVFFPVQSPTLASVFEGKPGAKAEGSKGPESAPTSRRRRLLKRFLAHSDSFRLWFLKLGENQRQELIGLMQGPGFLKLLEQLGLPVPTPADAVEGDESQFAPHEKSFEEFTHAMEWQDRQFFGFLTALSDDQLIALAKHTESLPMCFMLRYLRPEQSAHLLDALGPVSRSRILSELPTAKKLTLTEIAELENKMRAAVQKLPRLSSASRSDVDFWAQVLTHLESQESLLKAIEKTDPEMVPTLQRFRFKLDDVPTVAEDVVERVVSDSDNEELGLALAGTPAPVTDRLLKALSARRRAVLEAQLENYRSAPKDKIRQAVGTLTKRFRDSLAA